MPAFWLGIPGLRRPHLRRYAERAGVLLESARLAQVQPHEQ
jgi:hypothetical protein